MRIIFIAFMSLALSGCALTDKLLTNRITTTLAQDECRVDSRWAVFGISTPISAADCEAILAAQQARVRQQTPSQK
jgi:hypothetical protein